MKLLAAQLDLHCIKGLGPLSDLIPCVSPTPGSPGPAPSVLSKVLSMAVGVMTIVAFLWFLFVLFTGAVAWVGSEGEKTKLQEAQKKITHGLIGLIIVVSSIFLVRIIGIIIGVNILDLNGLILNLW